MNFRDFVLSLRYRIHDIRKPDGTRVTTAFENTITWQATELATIASQAIQDLSRTLLGMKLDNAINKSVFYREIPIVLSAPDGEALIDARTIWKIVRLSAMDSADSIYDEATPEQFADLRKRHMMRPLGQGNDVPKRYTVIFKDGLLIKTLPAQSIDVPAIATCIVPLNEFLVFDVSLEAPLELPFVGIDDLMLDFGEREVAKAEYNLTHLKNITEVINYKLELLKRSVSNDSK